MLGGCADRVWWESVLIWRVGRLVVVVGLVGYVGMGCWRSGYVDYGGNVCWRGV